MTRDSLEDAVMEGTAFSIEEAGFDASLLPEDCCTPGTEAFHRAVTDYFQKAYASMGGAFAAGVARFRQALAVAPDDLIRKGKLNR